MKKFWDKVEAAFKKLFGSTSWEKTLASVITYAAPIVQLLVTMAAGPAAGTIVGTVANAAKNDLATISAVVTDATSVPGASETTVVVNALNSLKTNLGSLLTDAGVKNSAESTTITNYANVLIGEVDAALNAIQVTPAAAPAVAAATA